MKNLFRLSFLFSIFLMMGFVWPFAWIFGTPNAETYGTDAWLKKQIQIIQNQAPNINPSVLQLSLHAYMNARRQGLANKQMLTVIDYSKPSTERRLWVFDLKHGRTLFNTWVTHGKNSGDLKAYSFSNNNGSLKSSIGVFVTDQPYIGNNGYSLRLRGLEPGVNDHAYSRDIVVHGAWYADPGIIKNYGQLGRSWGCPAVSTRMAKPLIDTIKENTLIFAYYPDRKWLNHSRFLVS